jgi:spermidine synthase
LSALVAPLLFRSVAEYPLALVAACLLRPPPDVVGTVRPPRNFPFRTPPIAPAHWDIFLPVMLGLVTLGLVMASNQAGLAGPMGIAVAFSVPLVICYLFLFRPVRFGLGIAAVLFAAQFRDGVHGKLLYAERSFFGVHRVTVDATGEFVQLVHGSTVHGMQRRDTQDFAPEPLTYYHRSGPIGQVFALPRFNEARPRVAVVGLGAGSLASYAARGQELDFYEIDAAVQRIAEDDRFFTFLKRCPGKYQIILGDARLKLAQSESGRYGLIVIDAFSSDAVPVHLLTREALGMYLDKLEASGLIACNVSSRYLELRPVLANLAAERHLVCLARADIELSPQERLAGKSPSIWVVLARQREDLGPLTSDPRWQRLPGQPDAAVWADDYANVLSTLKWE